MITVEDLLEKLDELLWTPPYENGEKLVIDPTWDRRFISDVSNYTRDNKHLSTSQSDLGLKLIKRYKKHLVLSGFDELAVEAIINSPIHRLQPYPSSNIRREVKYLGDNKLVFRFKYNPAIIERLRSIKFTNPYTGHTYPDFNNELKIWTLEVNVVNSESVMAIIRDFKFDFDDDLAVYFMNFENSKTTPSSAKVQNDMIVVESNNDMFFDIWLNHLVKTEAVDV